MQPTAESLHERRTFDPHRIKGAEPLAVAQTQPEQDTSLRGSATFTNKLVPMANLELIRFCGQIKLDG